MSTGATPHECIMHLSFDSPSSPLAVLLLAGALSAPAGALDHGEAPLVSRAPKTDGTDLFVFRSYERGREDFVTLIACFQPFQDPFAGPDYFLMDPEAVYDIHVDNDGDAVEDLTFRFRFQNELTRGSAGEPGPTGRPLSSPMFNTEPLTLGVDPPEAGIRETYTVSLIRHQRGGLVVPLTDTSGNAVFVKPADNVGTRSIPDYAAYAGLHVVELAAPAKLGRVFVGQRSDPRAIDMGSLFDLVHRGLLGPTSGRTSDLATENVTALALEVPVSLLMAGKGVIGVWSTASLPQLRSLGNDPDFDAVGGSGPYVQVSRTGAPLVGALMVGMEDKDRFNASSPSGDARFVRYFDFPHFPRVIEEQTGLARPVPSPRTDVMDFFMLGLPGLTAGGAPAEVLHFRYSVMPVPAALQDSLGVLGGDLAGYPNGRRPGDDVVDITLRILMGAMLAPPDAPSGALPLTDGVAIDALDFETRFPYLTTPLAGAD